MKEYVFFIGPRKTGTTSFYEVLRQANATISPTVKESFFFDQESPDILKYQPRYSLDPSEPFAETSPSYFTSLNAIQNIRTHFPDAKIIVTLRHPLKRAMSALSHTRRIGFLPQVWNDEDCPNNKHVQNILTASKYQHYIKLWSDAFPGNVCIIRQVENGKYDNLDVEKIGKLISVNIQPDIFSGTRANSALETRSKLIADYVQKIKSKLINAGFFRTIRGLKKLKPLLYRRQKIDIADSSAEAFFSTELSGEITYYENLPTFSIK